MGHPGRLAVSAAACFVALSLGFSAFAQEKTFQPDAGKILQLIETNGTFAFAAAAADIEAANARLQAARAHLYPRLTLDTQAQRYQSESRRDTGSKDFYANLELVQPLYDFGQTYGRIKAARSEVAAAEAIHQAARNTVLLEGLAVFFDLHASELLVRSLNEDHASAYVRWVRAKEREQLGRQDPVVVAEWLARVENTRLAFYRERSRNNQLRLRLESLTGVAFDDELIDPPKAPDKPPLEVDIDAIVTVVKTNNPQLKALSRQVEAVAFLRHGTGSRPNLEAFGGVGKSSRDLRGRNTWAVGARLNWPLFDGGIKGAERARLAAEQSRLNADLEVNTRRVVLRARSLWMNRSDSWQQVIAARARQAFAEKRLIQRQQLYQQERVADLGRAMIETTASESELVRAAGAFYLDSAGLAVLMGENPAMGLEAGFPGQAAGGGGTSDQYEPKGGSGFGQEDQNEVE